jgi:Domain of unknown function (DUF4394)/Calx-beta domain
MKYALVRAAGMRGLFTATVLTLIFTTAGTASAAEVFWGLTTDQQLVRFSDTAPGTPIVTLPITGLPAGEQMLAISIMSKGMFIGISSSGRVYTLDRHTGAATALAAQTGRLIVPSGAAFDFGNGELTSDTGQRIRINTSGDWGEILLPPFTPAGAHLVATGGGQEHAFGGNALAEEVVIDSATDQVYGVNRNANPPALLLVGALGVDTSDAAGLTNAVRNELDDSSRTAVYAALTVGGVPRLYLIDDTAHASLVGAIGSAPITSLTTDREVLRIIGPPGSTYPIPNSGAMSRVGLVEASTTVTFTLQRTGDDTVPADYQVQTLGGAATPGQDYVDVPPHSVHFEAGEAQKDIAITLIGDAVPERDEVFYLKAEEITSNFFRAADEFMIDILDDDNPAPVLTLTSPSSTTLTVLADSITISGTFNDDAPGVTASLLKLPLFEGSPYWSSDTSPFTFANIPLTLGVNRFSLYATDALGKTAGVSLVIVRGEEQSFIFAEGATGNFFDTDLLFANPNSEDVPVSIDFLREDGVVIPYTLTVPASRRVTVNVDAIPGLEATAMATLAHTSSAPIIAERTMRWGAGGYGASGDKASSAASTKWLFAEGSEGWFSTFLLLVNPQTSSNDVTVRFLLESGTPVTKTFTIAPRARLTIDAGSIPELVNQSFGMDVTFAQPGVAERSMYFGRSPLWAGGHESAGVTDAATEWFLAEGATGPFFETFVLAANPSSTPADVTFTFLTSTGAPITKTKQIAANGRLTVNIEMEDPALANVAVSTHVTSSVPIIVERSQYWPYTPDVWYEAHNSFGVTAPGTHWGLAEGRVGGPEGYQTYILLANPDPTQTAEILIRFLPDHGDPVYKFFSVPPASRFNVAVDLVQVPELVDVTFGAEIVSTKVPIIVERSMYSNANGQVWAAGTNATATRLRPGDFFP